MKSSPLPEMFSTDSQTPAAVFVLRRHSLTALALMTMIAPTCACAATLLSSEELFGGAYSIPVVGISADVGLIGNYVGIGNQGAAFVYRSLDTAAGTVTQQAKLTASDAADNDQFGWSTSISGGIGLVGANGDNSARGAAYVFRNLDTAIGTVTQNAKLTASNGAVDDEFGSAVSIAGNIGLVAAEWKTSGRGYVYLFRNLDSVTGSATQNAILSASDGVSGDHFGKSLSQSGTTGLVGAYFEGDSSRGWGVGAAYLFRNLHTATGTVTQNAKLIATDSVNYDHFGMSVSLSGNTALVGAPGTDSTRKGAAYVFRNLDTASGTVTQAAKLTASDGANGDWFGRSVSLSGNVGLVGADGDDDKGSNAGAVYLFREIGTASGSATEDVKIVASGGVANQRFGASVSLDGDLFMIGHNGSGPVRTGSVSSLTTLDAGDADRVISGLSFVSRVNWIVGDATDNNSVLLSAGDTANVTAADKAVFVGRGAGGDDNRLVIRGHLLATEVFIGSVDGNSGNALVLESSGALSVDSIFLADDNALLIAGDYTDNVAGLFGRLSGADLFVRDGENWEMVTALDHGGLFGLAVQGGYTALFAQAIPEPASAGVWLAGVALGVVTLRRKRRA